MMANSKKVSPDNKSELSFHAEARAQIKKIVKPLNLPRFFSVDDLPEEQKLQLDNVHNHIDLDRTIKGYLTVDRLVANIRFMLTTSELGALGSAYSSNKQTEFPDENRVPLSPDTPMIEYIMGLCSGFANNKFPYCSAGPEQDLALVHFAALSTFTDEDRDFVHSSFSDEYADLYIKLKTEVDAIHAYAKNLYATFDKNSKLLMEINDRYYREAFISETAGYKPRTEWLKETGLLSDFDNLISENASCVQLSQKIIDMALLDLAKNKRVTQTAHPHYGLAP